MILYSKIARRPINRLLSIVRYHRPQQLANRLIARCRKKILIATKGKKYNQPPPDNTQLLLDRFETRELLARYSSETVSAQTGFPSQGKLTLLNEPQTVGNPIDWRCSELDVTHLWRFHLHYHEFLLGIAFADQELLPTRAAKQESAIHRDAATSETRCATIETDPKESIGVVWDTIHHWIEQNPLSLADVHSDAWHPFCISRRLRVWFLLLHEFGNSIPADSPMKGSIWQQTNFLNDHLEEDLGGNHLLENLRALALPAAYLKCKDQNRWQNTVSRHVRRELLEQILPSGEHFERSPHYHIEMLDVVCDLYDATKEWDKELAGFCLEVAERMASFLPQILHPDGSPALFSDGAHENAERITKLCQRVDLAQLDRRLNASDETANDQANSQVEVVTNGNYWKYRSNADCMIFDAGPIGPNHLPAHGHSDLLNFEASLDGNRFIVDTGTFRYGEGNQRDYVRSTEAHNCLEVDGLNQCDVWSRFRLGHRGNAQLDDVGNSGEFFWAKARHNAYRDLGIKVVHRLIVCSPHEWLVFDWFRSSRPHKLRSRLHFGPEVTTDLCDRHSFFSRVAGTSILVKSLNAEKLDLEPAEYYPDFGITRQITKAIGISKQSNLCWTGWSICLKESNSTCNVRFTKRDGFRMSYSNESHKFEWKCDGLGFAIQSRDEF